MANKLRVKIKDSVFPIRINGARYRNGDELVIEENEFSGNTMELLEKVEIDAEFDALKDKAKELKIKGYTKMDKETLQAAIDETLAKESE